MNSRATSNEFGAHAWGLILGGSSGFGLATAEKLARHGMHIVVVHRDLRSAMPRIESEFDRVRAHGREFCALNVDALSVAGQERILAELRQRMGDTGRIRVLLHSIALGNLRSILHPEGPALRLGAEEFAGTLHAMGTSLVGWVQALHDAALFAKDARVLALTSEGARIAMPSYAAVGAAKACLEALVRSLAVELAPHGLRCNVIQAGITDTPALRHIPGHRDLLRIAEQRNPCGRTTLPTDVADVIYLLARDEAHWINGALIPVDGGESIAAFPSRTEL